MQLTPQDLTECQGGCGEQVTDELKNESTIRSPRPAALPPPCAWTKVPPLHLLLFQEQETGNDGDRNQAWH